MWSKRLSHIPLLPPLGELPYYAFQFVFKNLGDFKWPFILLSLCNILSNIFKFIQVIILGQIISSIAELSLESIFTYYIPIWILLALVSEVLGFFLRKYAESLPVAYSEHLQLRFYKTFLYLRYAPLINISKERLSTLVSNYTTHVKNFLSDWTWSTTGKITRAVLVLGVLYAQSPYILGFNLIYMFVFLAISFRISARFSPYAKELSNATLTTQATLQNFTLNLTSVKRLHASSYFLEVMKERLSFSWSKLHQMQSFHGNRWFFQLNLFNFLYIATLAYGIYQVKIGQLPLGFLVLIKWAYDELWLILVYMIEYYVSLIRQKEDIKIIKTELSAILHEKPFTKLDHPTVGFDTIELQDIHVQFPPKTDNHEGFSLDCKQLKLLRGEKIGILGRSGSGKSSLLHILLQMIPYQGKLLVDGTEIRSEEDIPYSISFVSNFDPLFQLSIRDNILLGRSIDNDRLEMIIDGLKIREFAGNLSMKIGGTESHLSAGQEQRIRLARGLINSGDLVLLDEPFNGLDNNTRDFIINFLKTYLKDKTVLLVTHLDRELVLVNNSYHISAGALTPL